MRIELKFGKVHGPLADFLNNNEKFQILDNKQANFHDKEIPPILSQGISADSNVNDKNEV